MIQSLFKELESLKKKKKVESQPVQYDTRICVFLVIIIKMQDKDALYPLRKETEVLTPDMIPACVCA